eukprot:5868711-Prymnesium_polylepis.1
MPFLRESTQRPSRHLVVWRMVLHVSPSLMRSACTNSTSERGRVLAQRRELVVSLIQSPEPNPAADRRRAR